MRPWVALDKAPAAGGSPSAYRFTYPSGPRDAKAALLGPGNLPIVFAREADGSTGIYTINAMPAPDSTTSIPTLTKVGTFTAIATGTPTGKPGLPNLVTGAATSPDGSRVVLRTYSDAYEYEVGTDGIVAAILNGTPSITPLPNDTRGESIAYSADGTRFITAGYGSGAQLLSYTPYTAPKANSQPT